MPVLPLVAAALVVAAWLVLRLVTRPDVGGAEARELVAGGARLVDVRTPREYAAGHLPGAINVPVDKLETYLSKLPKRKEVIAYCRGPYCLMSFEAVAKLRKRGFKAKRLADGYPEWRAAGLPVER